MGVKVFFVVALLSPEPHWVILPQNPRGRTEKESSLSQFCMGQRLHPYKIESENSQKVTPKLKIVFERRSLSALSRRRNDHSKFRAKVDMRSYRRSKPGWTFLVFCVIYGVIVYLVLKWT